MPKTNTYFFLLLLLSSCYSGSNGANSKYDERLAQYNFDENLDIPISANSPINIGDNDLQPAVVKASLLFQNRSYIELKTPENIIIGRVSKIEVRSDLMLIFDGQITKAAYLFNTDGEFLFEVGIKGQGPDEHDDIIDISLKDNSILLVDLRFRVYEYSLDNRLIKKQEIPIYSHSMHVFDDGGMAFSNNEIEHPQLGYQILIVDKQKISKRLIKNEGVILSKYSSGPLSNNRSVHNDDFLFAQPWGNTIYQVSKNTAEQRLKLNLDNPVTIDILDNPNKFEKEQLDHSFIMNWPVLETSNILIFRILSKGRVITIIYNKQDNSIKSFSGLADDLMYGGIYDFPLYVEGNQFYVPLSVEPMYDIKKKIELSTNEELLTKIKSTKAEYLELAKNLNEISNPIIMKCEIQ